MLYLYEPSYSDKGWWDSTSLIEGWFDESWSASAASSLDQSNESTSGVYNYVFGDTTNTRVAQTIQPSITQPISEFHVKLAKSGSPTDTLILNVYTDNAGTPDTLILTSTEVDGASLTGTATEQTFYFYNSSDLTADTVYWFVIERTGAQDGSNNYRIEITSDTSDIYTRGISYEEESSVWAYTSGDEVSYFEDFWFKQYGGYLSAPFTADPGAFDITGTNASLEYNRKVIASSGSYSITGTNANLEYSHRLIADSGVYAITGTAASLETNKEVLGESGTFSITGTDASLKTARKLVADSGSVAITGTNANLGKSFTMTVTGGAFGITGTAASLEYNRKVIADSGIFSVTGTTANLETSREVFAESGTVSITGADAVFTLGKRLNAESGTYAVNGSTALLTYDRVFQADTGAYSITGTDAGLFRGYTLQANSGSYSITGTDASFIYTPNTGYTLTAGSGNFAITGTKAILYIPRPPRSYYIDSDANIYWVINESLGLVERV